MTGLQHVYYTEQRLLDALSEPEEGSSSEEIREAFAEHRSGTETHVERLEEVFETLGASAEAAEDPVVEGMIEAHEEFVEEDPSDEVLDRFNVAAGQKS